jgi:uncharacterized protein (DUF983 family)
MSKTSKIEAVINAKCPKCRRGKMFSAPMYSFRSQKANEYCPHCGMRFEIEPGYFYAAMYVSYALSVAEMIAIAIGTYVITGRMEYEDLWLYIVTIIGGTILLSPFNFRYSRVLLLHYLSPKVKYNPSYDKE